MGFWVNLKCGVKTSLSEKRSNLNKKEIMQKTITLNLDQIETIKCAFADLCGAIQAKQQNDINAHDWKSHLLTLEEMENLFNFLPAIPANIHDE